MRYLWRRAIFYAIALWASLTVNFFLPRLLPGNPMAYFEMKFATQLATNPHLLDPLRAEFDRHSPDSLPVQYLHYLWNLAHLNFGVSVMDYPATVSQVLGQTLPWTLFLAGLSTVLAFVIGTLLGVVAAWWRGKAVDTVVTSLTMFVQSFPSFFVAMLILYFLGVVAGWFPLSRAVDASVASGLSLPFILSALDHAAMPLLALLLAAVGGWLFGMRAVMINTLSEDYVVMAQAKGLSTMQVALRYAARNALLPQITSFAIVLGYAVTALLLIENVFSYPGMGQAMVQAVLADDYPLLQGIFFVITTSMLLANLIADLLYARLDPRVRAAREA